MGYIISTVNMKGGVGKTTLTVNLATCLAKNYQKKVLVVDLDAQISATLSLMPPQEFAQIRKKRRTLSYLMDKAIRKNNRYTLDIADLICTNICDLPGLALLPGDLELYDEYLVSQNLHESAISQNSVDFSLVWNKFERFLVADILAPIQDKYDFILLDCAPGYNLLTRSGIASSDFYLLPARPEPLSLVGIQLLERRIVKLKESHQSTHPINLNLLGIIFILSGSTLTGRYYGQVIRRVKSDFSPEFIFDNAIPMDVNLAKAVDSFTPAVIATPNSSGAKSFVRLTQEFINKIAVRGS